MTSGARQALTLLGVGTLLGAAIWLLSPWVIGKAEPWDADAPIWLASWLIFAIAGGLIGKIRGVCLPAGYALGQVLITAQATFRGEFGVLGWMFIAGYAAVAACISLALIATVAVARMLGRSKGKG